MNKDMIFVFFDATDSGMSIDNIIDIKKFLKETVTEDCNSVGVSLFIIIATNAYEFANGEDCIDIQHMKHIRFNDYEEYKKFILSSAKFKEDSIKNMEDKNNG